MARSSARTTSREICRFLEETGFLHHSAGAWHWTSDTYPADATSLRSVTSDNFVVVDITGEPEVIAEVSFPTALTTLHEKAIYLHEARQYHVERFDYEERKAYVKRVDCDYYTDAIDYTQVKVLRRIRGRGTGGRAPRARRRARQPADRGLQEDQVLHHGKRGRGQAHHARAGDAHHGILAAFPGRLSGRLGDYTPTERQSGIAGLGNALRTVAALLLMCDPRDLGVALSEQEAGQLAAFEPNLYLYDTYPGGVGQSAPLYRFAPRLLSQTAELLAACPCEAGCPSCVGPTGEVGERGKEVAARILAELGK